MTVVGIGAAAGDVAGAICAGGVVTGEATSGDGTPGLPMLGDSSGAGGPGIFEGVAAVAGAVFTAGATFGTAGFSPDVGDVAAVLLDVLSLDPQPSADTKAIASNRLAVVLNVC